MRLITAALLAVLPICFAVPMEEKQHGVYEKRQYGGGGNDDPYGGRHKWIPASQVTGASRTSCPFLNTAANHGFLPRNGRQISIAQFNQAIVDSLNFSPDFANGITTAMLGKLGVLTNDSNTDARLRVDLQQTNAHGKTEHDASITRLDLSEGDNLHVQPSLIKEFLEDTIPMAYPYLNTSSVGRTRVRRERESLRLGNPPLTDIFFTSAQGEAALIILIMGDDNGPVTEDNADSRRVPKRRVQSWLANERFPTDEGFKRPSRQIQQTENGFIVQSIAKWQAWMEDSGITDGEQGESPEHQSTQSGQKGQRGQSGQRGSGGSNGYLVNELFGLH